MTVQWAFQRVAVGCLSHTIGITTHLWADSKDLPTFRPQFKSLDIFIIIIEF